MDRFHDNILVAKGSDPYAQYNCECKDTKGSINACPVTYGNRIFTPDGTMGLICNQTLDQRKAAGLDNNTVLEKWPEPTQLVNWGRKVIGLAPIVEFKKQAQRAEMQ